MRPAPVKTPLFLILVLLTLLAIGWVVVPTIVPALPGRVRQYLPESVAAATAPPLPTPVLAAAAESDLLATIAGPATPQATPQWTATAVEVPPTPATPAAAVTSDAGQTPATATAAPAPTMGPTLPASVYLEGVDIRPQKFNNCGPANLSIVLAYHGAALDQLDIAAAIRPNYEDRNVSPHELAHFVETQTGLAAQVISGADEVLVRQMLAARLPVIVEKGLTPDEEIGWMGHYLTLYGYDDRQQAFFVRDTFLGPWEEDGWLSYDALAVDWHAFGNLLVVVYPTDAQVVVDGILGDRADPAVMWQHAADQARAAVREDPGDPFAWFNLGTALTHQFQFSNDSSQLAQATSSFDQARLLGLPARMLWYQFAPYEAYLAAGRVTDVIELAEATLGSQGGRNVEETYIYQALALRAQGDGEAATRALQTAQRLHPDNPLLITMFSQP